MQASSFDCKIGISTISFTIEENGTIKIKQPMLKEIVIKHEELIKIYFVNQSDALPGMGYCFSLYLKYYKDGKEKKKRFIMPWQQASCVDLLNFLKNNFSNKSYIGINELEKQNILSLGYSSEHRLYSRIITAVFLAMFLIFATMGIALALIEKSSLDSSSTMNTVGIASIIISILFLAPTILIATKKFMVIKTDNNGLTYKKVFSGKTIPWSNFVLGNPKFSLIRNFSEGISLLVDKIVVVPIEETTGKRMAIKLSLNAAGKLYRELFYREKASYQQAKKTGAFL